MTITGHSSGRVVTGYRALPRCPRAGCQNRVEPQEIRRGRPKRYCSDACRQAAAHAVATELARHEWGTPRAMADAARVAMDGVDLDPASSPKDKLPLAVHEPAALRLLR